MTVELNYCREDYVVSIAHKNKVWHFRRAYQNTVKLSVIDLLDSDESIPGEIAPRVPNAVKDELKQEGLEIYE